MAMPSVTRLSLVGSSFFGPASIANQLAKVPKLELNFRYPELCTLLDFLRQSKVLIFTYRRGGEGRETRWTRLSKEEEFDRDCWTPKNEGKGCVLGSEFYQKITTLSLITAINHLYRRACKGWRECDRERLLGNPIAKTAETGFRDTSARLGIVIAWASATRSANESNQVSLRNGQFSLAHFRTFRFPLNSLNADLKRSKSSASHQIYTSLECSHSFDQNDIIPQLLHTTKQDS